MLRLRDGERLVLVLVLLAAVGALPSIAWPQWAREAYAYVSGVFSDDVAVEIPGASSPLDNADGLLPSLGAITPAQVPAAQALIAALPIAPEGPIAGYDRSCSPGDGCVFGPAWTDDQNAALGHDGCDTRNQILARDGGSSVQFKAGQSCKVIALSLLDPYTGTTLTDRADIQIDHIIPLARAWRMGASTWDLATRTAYANDPLNLLAVDASANQSKSDHGPSEWMPANTTISCAYATRYAQVATRYALPVTTEDKTVLSGACSS